MGGMIVEEVASGTDMTGIEVVVEVEVTDEIVMVSVIEVGALGTEVETMTGSLVPMKIVTGEASGGKNPEVTEAQ